MKTFIFLILAILTFMPVISCVYHELDAPSSSSITNALLFEEINAAGFEYYEGGTILLPASASPHGSFKLRFNKEALASLDATGELPNGSAFMDGSVIVKEVYDNNVLDVYAVMKKAPSDVNAANSWLWAEYRPDGGVLIGLASRGSACTSCHDDLPNRDFVRTFDFH